MYLLFLRVVGVRAGTRLVGWDGGGLGHLKLSSGNLLRFLTFSLLVYKYHLLNVFIYYILLKASFGATLYIHTDVPCFTLCLLCIKVSSATLYSHT